jgi:phosphopentomutase
MHKTISAMEETKEGLIFVNLVDFDQQYGHRNDVEGYASALEAVDRWIPQLESAAQPGDLLIFTADHGCDPTTPSTDHTREYVPLIVKGGKPGIDLGLRSTLSDLGQTVAENFDCKLSHGQSFLNLIS